MGKPSEVASEADSDGEGAQNCERGRDGTDDGSDDDSEDGRENRGGTDGRENRGDTGSSQGPTNKVGRKTARNYETDATGNGGKRPARKNAVVGPANTRSGAGGRQRIRGRDGILRRGGCMEESEEGRKERESGKKQDKRMYRI